MPALMRIGMRWAALRRALVRGEVCWRQVDARTGAVLCAFSV